MSLYHDMSIDHLEDVLQRTLQTLVKPVSISQDCMDALQQHIPHRLLAQQGDHTAACDTILNQRQPQRHVGRNVAMPEAVRPEGVCVWMHLHATLPSLPLLHTTSLPFKMSLYEFLRYARVLMQPPLLRHPLLQSPCAVIHLCRLYWFWTGGGGADVILVDDE